MRDQAAERAARVQLMIFDVDGVLTDGGLHYGAAGEVIKTFNVLDGLGIKLLQGCGVTTAIISARKSEIVTRRAGDLGIAHVFQSAHDKRVAFDQLLAATGFSSKQCGFIGDDVLDLPVLRQVEFAASVPNAHSEVRSRVHYVTEASGGRGAARELCDFILRAQGRYETLMASYLA
jgi:3-deoxy-D-manno-octulosonate 8-phosphate phosphatase (KDO 8-P phosphatase)